MRRSVRISSSPWRGRTLLQRSHTTSVAQPGTAHDGPAAPFARRSRGQREPFVGPSADLRHPSLPDELQQVSQHGPGGCRMELLRVLGVDTGDQVLGCGGPFLERDQDLPLPVLAVLHIFPELVRRGPHGRPVTRIDDPRFHGEQSGEGPHVGGHVAVRWVDHARAPPQDEVPGEQGTRLRLVEDEVVARVPRRVHGLNSTVPRRYERPVGQPALARSRAMGKHGRPGLLGEESRTGRMVGVVVGEQDRTHRVGVADDLADMVGIVRPGIDHEGRPRPDDPGVRALQRERAGIRGQNSQDAWHPAMMAE